MTHSLKVALSDAGFAPPLEAPPASHSVALSPPPAIGIRRACIEVDEIAAGIVVRLDPITLTADPRVINTQVPPAGRSGPFVCVAADAEELTVWAGLTTGKRRERLPIKPEWRSGGYRRWRQTPQFLTDGASLWCGPRHAFVVASYQERATRSQNRARISAAGLAAIRREIGAQGHRRSLSVYDPRVGDDLLWK